MEVVIEAAKAMDLPALEARLQENGLPLEGVRDHLTTMLVARAMDNLIGSAGLEVYGSAALLRSVAVAEAYRGQGLGQRLTQAALALAQQQGMTEVFLLTETASEFFPRLGFEAITRHEVTPAVRQSVEFVSACPESALAMRRAL
jgi:amino-acid N-acetyltransferase